MVLTRNISRSNANQPRMQDQPGDVNSLPPGALETMQANTDEVEVFCLTNQRLIGELEQITRQMQSPREARQTQEGHNITPHEGKPHLGTPRGAEAEAESNRARRHRPHLTLERRATKQHSGGTSETRTKPPSTRNGGTIMGAKVQGPPTGAQWREGCCEGPSP